MTTYRERERRTERERKTERERDERERETRERETEAAPRATAACPAIPATRELELSRAIPLGRLLLPARS